MSDVIRALQRHYERCVLQPLIERMIALILGTGFADSDGGECD